MILKSRWPRTKHGVLAFPKLAVLLFMTMSLGSVLQAQIADPSPLSTEALPHSVPLPPPLPEPQDTAYLGEIRLSVDATDITHRILNVRESIPVKGGSALTLLFPQWTTGDHTPNGALDKLAGLVVMAAGQRLEWQRDSVQMYAFHITVPQRVTQLDLQYQFLSPTDRRYGTIVMTPTMLDLQWQSVILYPAGYYARDIVYRPSLVLPEHWQYASALDGASIKSNIVSFPSVALDTLIDSPVMAAKFMKQLLIASSPVPVRLNIAADDPKQLVGADAVSTGYKNVVEQAEKLFGAHHYDHYDFMLWLSSNFGPVYYEHHRSGENSLPGDSIAKYSGSGPLREAMLHGYVHSWNGTFRRPAEMWTPDFNTPERDKLVWIFEGLTMYWEAVLSARGGLTSAKEQLESFGDTAARASIDAGAEWRPFEDVNYGPVIAFRKPEPWSTWQRDMFDAYSGGQLIWLEVDAIIRTQTDGQRSLDDFARSFFGQKNGSYATETYSFPDVLAALQAITPYNWEAFFTQRLKSHRPGDSIADLQFTGYKLVYNPEPESPDSGGEVDLTFSLGMIIGTKGNILAVHWKGPAFLAGANPNEEILSVDGQPYSPDALLSATRNSTEDHPIALTVQNGQSKDTILIRWHGGLRYPRLERISTIKAALDAALQPLP